VSRDRENAVTRAFVGLASSLAEGYDVVDLLSTLTSTCADLLDVDSAGLLLANRQGVLHVLAASSDASRDLELLQLQSEEGPCLECFRDGAAVSVADLDAEQKRWPRFAPAAVESGFRSVHAVPLRLRRRTLGAMGLFGTHTGALNDEDLSLGQALADVASVSLFPSEAAEDDHALSAQLQRALSSRMLVEQAKGFLAQVGDLEMDQAFRALQAFAREHRQGLTSVAGGVVSRVIPAELLLAGVRERGPENPTTG
jgi:transcriptional regulator with GAF, ATPase, and Fis domain